MTPSEFKLIREADLKLTQAQLASRLGVDRTTVSAIERGLSVPLVYQLAIRHLVWCYQIQPAILLMTK